MKFYFDESGEFIVPAASKFHRAAVVMGVAVPESSEKKLFDRYSAFARDLDDSERSNGEPKGKLLTKDSQQKFCDVLSTINGIMLTPVTLDLSSLADYHTERFSVRMGEFLTEVVSDFPESSPFRKDIEKLAKQFKNITVSQALRLYAWANCFREVIEHAILFRSYDEYKSCWEKVQFYIDPVQTSPNNVEKKIFSNVILGWLCAWFNKTLALIDGIHSPDNPFVQKYCFDNKIDIGKLIQGNIRWTSSSGELGLQIADISAYITYRAVTDLDDSRGSISMFVSLMRSSPYGWPRGPGLFTPLELGSTTMAEGKYLLIREALKAKK